MKNHSTSINPPTTTHPPADRLSGNKPTNQPIHHSTNQLINHLQSANQRANKQPSQSSTQSIDQPTNHITLGCYRRIRLGWVYCRLFPTQNQSQPMKTYLLWEKMAQMPLLAWCLLGWVGRGLESSSVSIYIYMFFNPTEFGNVENTLIIHDFANQSANQINQPTDRPTNQPPSQTINQIDQPIRAHLVGLVDLLPRRCCELLQNGVKPTPFHFLSRQPRGKLKVTADLRITNPIKTDEPTSESVEDVELDKPRSIRFRQTKENGIGITDFDVRLVEKNRPVLDRKLPFHKTQQNFSTFWQAFSPGDVKNCSVLSQWAIDQFSRRID